MNYIKTYWLCFYLVFNGFIAFGQQYGNEWINYNQSYLYFPVVSSGIHQIDYYTLNNGLNAIGADLSQINHDQLQLFGRENEISISVNDFNNNGYIDSVDFITFYAKKNDGWIDHLAYDTITNMPDAYYSLFNDTINYFLTWNNSFNNKRTLNETDINYSNYTQKTFCWKEEIVKYNSEYVPGAQQSGLSSPKYELGEGWAGPRHQKNGSYTENVNTANYQPTGPDAFGIANIIASNSSTANLNNENHNTKLYVNSNLIYDSSYYGYACLHLNFNLSSSLISNTTAVNHTISNIGQGTDYQYVSSIALWYPHNFNFSSYNEIIFGLSHNAGQKQRISITNMLNGAVNPKLYYLDDIDRTIPLVFANNNWEAVIPPPSSDSVLLFLYDSSNVHNVTDLTPVNQNGSFTNFPALQVDSAYIIITHKNLLSSSRQYASYRSVQYDTLVVDVEELYHQFGGGIFKNSIAIKRFLTFTMDQWPAWPSHLFLIGKSVKPAPEAYEPGSRKDSASYAINLVPTWGMPGSDNHFSTNIYDGTRSYLIPTGRLSANSASDVDEYLQKMMELESNQDPMSNYTIAEKEWQKNVLHFGGGSDSTEQVYINGWLEIYKRLIEDTLYGGTVFTFNKDPFSNDINNNDFQFVQSKLEEGVSLITFFGHSGSSIGFSQNIDAPENWNNQGKYPVVIGLGCYTGDVHGIDNFSYGEKIVNAPNAGAIGFISTSSLGKIPYINNYAEVFYEQVSPYYYGQTVGQQMLQTVKIIDKQNATLYWNPAYESCYNGMALQGDPAVRINSHQKPELILDETRAWFTPEQIDLAADSFDVNVVISNVGKAFSDSFRVEVQQFFPDLSDTLYSKDVGGVRYRDTIIMRLPLKPEKSIGINDFRISVDLPISSIDEQFDDFTNNEIYKNTIISTNSLIPIWPYQYGIVGTDSITLKGSTMNPFEKEKKYFFQLDTSRFFSSPFLKEQEVISLGGVVEASPLNWINNNTGLNDPLTLIDSTVYFWRCAVDSSVIKWEERSFQFINNKWGWSQAHFHQITDNNYTNILIDSNLRRWEFDPTNSTIMVDSYVNFTTGAQWEGTSWRLGGDLMDYGGWLWPSIIVGVVDKSSLKPWCVESSNGIDCEDCHSYHCVGQFNGENATCSSAQSNLGRNRCHKFFIFHYRYTHELDSLANFLTNYIPDSNYVIAYSYIPENFSSPAQLYNQWPTSLFNAFNNLGATGFQPGMADDGFVFFTKKGDVNSTIEIHTTDSLSGSSPNPVEYLSTQQDIIGRNGVGWMKTNTIGPAKNWNAIYWNHQNIDVNNTDSLVLSVFGVNNINSQMHLFDTIFSNKDSILNLSSIVDPQLYRSLKFELFYFDSINGTPAKMKNWMVLYDPAPELALNPKKGFYSNFDDPINQGAFGEFAIAIENISPFDMDSLLTDYTTYNENYSYSNLNYERSDSLRSHDVFLDTISFNTTSLNNQNFLQTTSNPRVNGNIQDQLEQYYFNNIAINPFQIASDKINPLLDVTFDGVHIMNQDIINSQPEIIITLKDENTILMLNEDADTSNIQVYLMRPNQNSWDRIPYQNQQDVILDYVLADEQNPFKITYHPIFTEDGIYQLKVQGRDKSGNISGDSEYEISFEVINRSTITNIFNYPNPFSSKTHFVFTLTGHVIPDQIKLTILTVSGKVVKQINLTEEESIKIGHNMTQYYWDGRDEYGAPLANGVYLYKVDALINETPIENRPTNADQAFKKGFGKMYLLR